MKLLSLQKHKFKGRCKGKDQELTMDTAKNKWKSFMASMVKMMFLSLKDLVLIAKIEIQIKKEAEIIQDQDLVPVKDLEAKMLNNFKIENHQNNHKRKIIGAMVNQNKMSNFNKTLNTTTFNQNFTTQLFLMT